MAELKEGSLESCPLIDGCFNNSPKFPENPLLNRGPQNPCPHDVSDGKFAPPASRSPSPGCDLQCIALPSDRSLNSCSARWVFAQGSRQKSETLCMLCGVLTDHKVHICAFQQCPYEDVFSASSSKALSESCLTGNVCPDMGLAVSCRL